MPLVPKGGSQSWHSSIANVAAAHVPTDSSSQRSPEEGKVLRAIANGTSTARTRDTADSDGTRQPTPAAKHDIWGTLEQLDASIQRRNNDVRSFTASLLQLQADAKGSPSAASSSAASSSQQKTSAPGLRGGDFFYA
jgi:hypothetical protein